jgi:hypothetical protein
MAPPRVLLCAAFALLQADLASSTAPTLFSRRAGLTPPQQLIKEPTRIGAGSWLNYPNDRGVVTPTRFSWSHGTPVQSVASTESGLFVANTTAAPLSGFEVSVTIPSSAVVVRVFVGSAGSLGQLNVTLFDSRSKEIGVASYLRPASLSQTLTVRFGTPTAAAAGASSLRVTWVQGDEQKAFNMNFQAVAVHAAAEASASEALPCAEALCTVVVSCQSNCTTVDLDAPGSLDWLHAGDSSLWPNPHPHPKPAPPPPPPFPGPPQCKLPASLDHREPNNHLQILGPPGGAAGHAEWLASLRSWRTGCRAALKLSSTVYEIEELEWTQTAYYQV